jgi:hypothetical protein
VLRGIGPTRHCAQPKAPYLGLPWPYPRRRGVREGLRAGVGGRRHPTEALLRLAFESNLEGSSGSVMSYFWQEPRYRSGLGQEEWMPRSRKRVQRRATTGGNAPSPLAYRRGHHPSPSAEPAFASGRRCKPDFRSTYSNRSNRTRLAATMSGASTVSSIMSADLDTQTRVVHIAPIDTKIHFRRTTRGSFCRTAPAYMRDYAQPRGPDA